MDGRTEIYVLPLFSLFIVYGFENLIENTP